MSVYACLYVVSTHGSKTRFVSLAFIGRFVRVFRPRRESDRVSSTNRSRYVRITANFCSFHATAEHREWRTEENCFDASTIKVANVPLGTWYPVDRSRCSDSLLSRGHTSVVSLPHIYTHARARVLSKLCSSLCHFPPCLRAISKPANAL